MITRRKLLTTSASALGGALAVGPLAALAQPTINTARIVVGFAAGGSTDVLARLLGERLRGKYASTTLVENKPGAGGRLGVEAVKTAETDGSVLLLTPGSMMWIYPHVYKKLRYDPVRDFTAVSPVGTVSFGLSVGSAVPASVKSVADYLKWAKLDPKNASYGSPAAGATPHFIGVMLGRAGGVELNHIAYKGGSPALQDVMGGQIPASINVLSEIIPLMQTGKLRVLATSGSKRSTFLPNVPTFVESGYKDVVAQEVFGLFVNAKVPAANVNRLNSLVLDITKTKDFRDAIAQLSYEPASDTPAGFAKTMATELERWRPIVQASGFTAEE
jgi:tripartite-type tricarboxylate transporter receptor subunit TctC